MAGSSSFEFQNFSADETERYQTVFTDSGIEGFTNYAIERLNAWRHIKLNIGVIGESGAGKSSFINAIRGLKEGDEGAAFTDIVEATSEIRPYKHPSNGNIVFWDFPGVGTDTFTREDYLTMVNFRNYDFFLILSSGTFTQNDGLLANEIKRIDKRFYFVRTKVDVDIYNDNRSRRTPRPQEDILRIIRSNCQVNLNKHGLRDSKIFLIDNYDQEKYDFDTLKTQLINDAPNLMREVLAFSIIGRTDSIILKKKELLKNRILTIALISAAAGAVPIPGVGVAVDIPILLLEIKFYREQFGLTDEALQNGANILGISVEELKSTFDLETFLISCTTKGMIALCRTYALSQAAAGASKFVLPIIGSVVSAGISYKTTTHCLSKMLEKMYVCSLKLNREISMHAVHSSQV